jgi:carbonic anhydrase
MIGTELESVISSLDGAVDSADSSRSETALLCSCSMSSYKHREVPWPVDPSWDVVDVPTIGNQTWTQTDGETALDDTFAYLSTEYDVTAALVVGHTSCDVVEDAYEHWATGSVNLPAGVQARLRPLISLTETAYETGLIDESTPIRTAQYRLVELNVLRQVAFLSEVLPESATAVGYVHDQDGIYGQFPDNSYMVALDDRTGANEIREGIDDEAAVEIATLL